MVEALMARENLQPREDHLLDLQGRGRGPKEVCFQWEKKQKNNSLLPKVTKFHHAALAQHNVLRFHITMENAVGVQVVQSRQQLAGHLSHLWGAEKADMARSGSIHAALGTTGLAVWVPGSLASCRHPQESGITDLPGTR